MISFCLEIDYEVRQIPDRSVLSIRAESMAFEWDMQHAASRVVVILNFARCIKSDTGDPVLFPLGS